MDTYEYCPTLIGRLLPGEPLRIETEPSECQRSRGWVYQVKIDENNRKPEPTISLDVLKQYQKDIEYYLI